MSTNLTIEQANDLLQKIGVEVAVVAEAEQADKNADLENIAKGVFNEMETKIKHDVEYDIREEARSAEAGKHLNSLRTLFKREFGIDEKEMKDLPQQEIVKLAKAKIGFDKNKQSADKEEAESDLLKRYNELMEEKNRLEEGFTGQLSAKDAEWMEKFQEKDMEERLFSLVNATARTSGDPSAQKDAIKYALKSKYHVKYNESTKEIEIYDKANPEKKMFDGKNLITDKYFVEKELKSLGVVATDMRHVNPADVMNGKETKTKAGIANIIAEEDPMKFMEESFAKA